MDCYVQSQGHGADLVMLHGWGLHGGIFERLAHALSSDYCVHLVDLPGHGYTPLNGAFDPIQIAQQLNQQFPLPCHILGWSLGGLVAQYWASQSPKSVKSLTLVASSPVFIQKPDWPYAQAKSLLEQVATRLQTDLLQTLKDFLALQMLGAPQARQTIKSLEPLLLSHGQPQGIEAALQALIDADARADLRKITAPTALIFGEKDKITPIETGRWLASQLDDACLYPFDQASHAPFLSHEADFLQTLRQHLETHA